MLGGWESRLSADMVACYAEAMRQLIEPYRLSGRLARAVGGLQHGFQARYSLV